MKRLRVYVAGAYSDTNVLRVLKNIGRGQYWSSRLFMKGLAPFSPWFDKEFVIQNWEQDFRVEDFYEYSIEWLKVSEAVFVVPNIDGMKNWEDSGGVKEEIEIAKECKIPVFFSEISYFFLTAPF